MFPSDATTGLWPTLWVAPVQTTLTWAFAVFSAPSHLILTTALRSRATQVSIHSCLHSAISIYLVPGIVLGIKGIVEGGLILLLKMKNRPQRVELCSFVLSIYPSAHPTETHWCFSTPGPELSVPHWKEVGGAHSQGPVKGRERIREGFLEKVTFLRPHD